MFEREKAPCDEFIVIRISGFLKLHMFYLFGNSMQQLNFVFLLMLRYQVLLRCIGLNFITAVEPVCILSLIQMYSRC